jgi:hypothetical protein
MTGDLENVLKPHISHGSEPKDQVNGLLTVSAVDFGPRLHGAQGIGIHFFPLKPTTRFEELGHHANHWLNIVVLDDRIEETNVHHIKRRQQLCWRLTCHDIEDRKLQVCWQELW